MSKWQKVGHRGTAGFKGVVGANGGRRSAWSPISKPRRPEKWCCCRLPVYRSHVVMETALTRHRGCN